MGGWSPYARRWVAGCLLEGSVQACLQVEDHTQEDGYFDVNLGGYTRVVHRYTYIDITI